MYITLQEANDWLEARGYESVTKEELQAAQDYLDAVYGNLFVGVPVGSDAWPRDGAVNCYGQEVTNIPDAVKYAVALIASTGVYQNTLSTIKGATSITEGALSVTFGAGGAQGGFSTNPMVDAMLACLLRVEIPVRLV